MASSGEYEPSPIGHVRKQVAEYEASEGARNNSMKGRPVVILTSRGRRSGKVRKTPLMRVAHDGVYAAVASVGSGHDRPDWYWNLLAEPRVELRDGASVGRYVAREVRGEERELWWARAVEAWPDYQRYQDKTERPIPVFLLDPHPTG